MMDFLKQYKSYFLFTILGAALGWLGYKFIGCTTGMCFFINPVSSVIKGAVFGLIFAFDPEPFRKKKQ
jgi:hypothetical protein